MKIKLAIIILAFFSIGWEAKSQDIVKKNFELAEIQYQAMLKKAMDITCFPRTVKQDKLWCVPAEDWTSGFWRAFCGICMSIQRTIVGKMKQ